MIGFGRGFIVFGQRVPVRLHWTIPVGALVLGGFEVRPWFWLAFVTLTFLHELGHAVLVWRFKLHVTALDVHGFGGTCHWRGAPTPIQRAAIAWGGVLAQAVVLLVTLLVSAFADPPRQEWSLELYSAFTRWNLMIIGLNLLPIPPLDGSKAWQILPLLAERQAARKAAPQGSGMSWEVKRRNAIKKAQGDADIIDLERARTDRRQRKTLDQVDAEIQALVDKSQKAGPPLGKDGLPDKNKLN